MAAMDFLDKIAHGIGGIFSRRGDTNTTSPSIPHDDKSVTSTNKSVKVFNNKRGIRLDISPRKNYSEVNFRHQGKVLNDNYEKQTFRQRYDLRDSELMSRVLPFINSGEPVVEWIYRNRYGVFTTVGLYLFIVFAFFMWRFNIYAEPVSDGIAISFDEIIIPDIVEPEKPIDETDPEAFDPNQKVDNLVSNELGKQEWENFFEDRSWQSELKSLIKEQSVRENAINGDMQEYNKRMLQLDKETEVESDEAHKKRDSLRNKDDAGYNKQQKGNVTVSYTLKDRTALFLEVPSYRCEGGGKVVVRIDVNSSGEVVGATVLQAFGVTDDCVSEMAVWASKRSLFNNSNSAPPRQSGTITFIFVAQ